MLSRGQKILQLLESKKHIKLVSEKTCEKDIGKLYSDESGLNPEKVILQSEMATNKNILKMSDGNNNHYYRNNN